MTLGNLRPFALAILALLLAGCIASENPLFDAATAVTPAAAGRYEKQQMEEGRWTKLRLGTLKLEGRTYEWKGDDEAEDPRFSLYPAGKDNFVVHAPNTEPGKQANYYALMQQTAEGYLFYQPLCSDLKKVRLPERLRPKIVKDNCLYSDRATLAEALSFYASVMEPDVRYVPAKP